MSDRMPEKNVRKYMPYRLPDDIRNYVFPSRRGPPESKQSILFISFPDGGPSHVVIVPLFRMMLLLVLVLMLMLALMVVLMVMLMVVLLVMLVLLVVVVVVVVAVDGGSHDDYVFEKHGNIYWDGLQVKTQGKLKSWV